MANAYGNTVGTANSKFRVVCEYSSSDLNNGYYQYRYRFYIQVTTGNFYGTNITKSWGGTTSVSGTGTYGYSNYYTKNIAYGSAFTLGSTAYAQYTASQTYRSQISGSTKIATAPTKTYTITYNANGGSGAPGKQTKTYGKTLKLSTTKPTRTGYTFQGWGTSATDTSVNYAAGANYTSNANITLYAIWKANTYTVKYNANGGSGAPGNQTKTYGVNLTLSSTKPTRTNYNFLGWGTSAASTTVAYDAGGSYTTNADITLYAIWELAYSKPVVTNLIADRCNASGELAEDGQYAKVVFNWQIDAVNSGGLTSVVIQWKQSSATAWNSTTAVSGGTATSGAVSKVVGNNALDTEYDYDIQIVVTDTKGNATYSIVLPAMKYIIDFLSGGNGVRIGGPASRVGFRDQFNTVFSNGCANVNFTTEDILDPDTTLESLIMTNVNTPNTGYMYIHTMFNKEKSAGANRSQIAIPYNSVGSTYHRYYYNGVWSAWQKNVTESELNASLSNIKFEIIESDRYYVKKYDNGWFEADAKTTVAGEDLTFNQIGTSGIYYARVTHVGIGITATEVFDIEYTTRNAGITWGASPSMNANMQAVDGYIVQYGADKTRNTDIRVHVTGKWK